MKTLYEHLHPEGIFDYRKADELCLELQPFAKRNFEYEKETRVVLYRFAILELNYLALECNPEDFTFESMVKLLHCETECDTFQTDQKTVFDVLMTDATEKPGNAVIHMMYEYYESYLKHMPKDAIIFYKDAWKYIARKFEIEYDAERIAELWLTLNEQKEEEAKKTKTKIESDFEPEYLLSFLLYFRQWRTTGHDKHKESTLEALQNFPDEHEIDSKIKMHCEALLDDFETYNSVLGFVKNLKGGKTG